MCGFISQLARTFDALLPHYESSRVNRSLADHVPILSTFAPNLAELWAKIDNVVACNLGSNGNETLRLVLADVLFDVQ